MQRAKFGYSVTISTLLLFTLAGCKVMDDKLESGSTDLTTSEARGRYTAPEIWGTPATSVQAGTAYAFQPEASDRDGDVLQFKIKNPPSWADFDPDTGLLSGTPSADDIGEHTNIIVSVTDQRSVSSLASFNIDVHDGGGSGDGGSPGDEPSSPPVITGKPNTSAVVGQKYVFQSEATDPDGDDLSFSIVNKPSWAWFNTATGRLGGVPSQADIGKSDAIQISVTDGHSVSSLKKFTIHVEATGNRSVTLEWEAPTSNADGSPLTDLAGYRIYYGTAHDDYSETVEIDSPGVTSYVLENLTAGTYFLAMTSVNSDSVESDYSMEISFEI